MNGRKKLKKILEGVEIKSADGALSADISGIAADSKAVKEGFVFVAIKGSRYDGHDFIKEALDNGARVIVSQEDFCNISEGRDITRVVVSDTRQAIARIAHNFYDRPADKMRIIGVTGTNGKTTVSYLVEGILRQAGFNVGVLGTVNYRYASRQIPATNTTPGSLQLAEMLHNMSAGGADYAVMEVSSHSLTQRRVEGIDFKTAVFTNITPEHLDYHKNMQEYKNVKALLFEGLLKNATAVLNSDDDFAKELMRRTTASVLKYGLDNNADIKAKKVFYGMGKYKTLSQPLKIAEGHRRRRFSCSSSGIEAVVSTPAGSFQMRSKLVGKFNLYNILAAIAAAVAEGIQPSEIASGIEAVKTVPGRLQELSCGQPFKVYVDYAHTDDALRNILTTLRELTAGRIITLFGCGGDRDTSKRPRMAKVASELSDYVVVTTDNPRSEQPQAIADEVIKGVPKDKLNRSLVILDRQEAIKKAIGLAREGDIVLLAGKGHETYQVFKDRVQPFDDREVAKKALIELGHKMLCLQ